MVQFLVATCEEGSALASVVSLLRTAVDYLQILIPIALILWGTIDMGKAVIAGDEKKIKEAQKPFIKRLISAVIVFLIPFILNLVIGVVATGKNATAWTSCWNEAGNGSWQKINTDDVGENNKTGK